MSSRARDKSQDISMMPFALQTTIMTEAVKICGAVYCSCNYLFYDLHFPCRMWHLWGTQQYIANSMTTFKCLKQISPEKLAKTPQPFPKPPQKLAVFLILLKSSSQFVNNFSQCLSMLHQEGGELNLEFLLFFEGKTHEVS